MAKTIKLEQTIWDRVVAAAESAGYSSPEELIVNAVEKELVRLEEAEASAAVEKRLKGLGYLE